MNIQPIPTLESSICTSPNAPLRRITDPDQSLFLLKRIRNTGDRCQKSQSNHSEINISMNIQPIPTLERSICSSLNAPLRRITDPDQSLFLLIRIRNTSDQRPTSQSNHPEINISMNNQPIPTLESSIQAYLRFDRKKNLLLYICCLECFTIFAIFAFVGPFAFVVRSCAWLALRFLFCETRLAFLF
jgi:hypothetical protein